MVLQATTMDTVIITGASGNLGTATTKIFLDSGYRVIATLASEKDKSQLATHHNLDIKIVDLSDENAASDFIQSAIKANGRIHAALLLVGGFAAGNIAATSGADIVKQFSLNFSTAYFTARPLLQHMMSGKAGKIVFVGARPALVPAAGKNMVAYSLSKSLLFKLSEFINEEARGSGVTATVVVPSTIDTPFNRQSMPAANPADWVKPEQLAGILRFIVSDAADPLRESVLKVYNNA